MTNATKKATEAANDIWSAIAVGIRAGQDTKETFMFCVTSYLEPLFERVGELSVLADESPTPEEPAERGRK